MRIFPMELLDADFYERDVVQVARDLLGCVLVCRGTAGVIVETEAYHQSEPSCHAFRGITKRTEPLFGQPGAAYVYFTYGMHWCFNTVAEPEGVGAAVLVRAVVPIAGIAAMRERRERTRPLDETDLCSGPAKLVQAMDIRGDDNCRPLAADAGSQGDAPPSRWALTGEAPLPADAPLGGGDVLTIVRAPDVAAAAGVEPGDVLTGPRIGISAAQELPWRFGVAGSRYVSRPFPAQGRRRSRR